MQTLSGLAQKYPVMFYIHGGEFVKGASNLFPGHVMAAYYEVVVVTINYRLGALGMYNHHVVIQNIILHISFSFTHKLTLVPLNE